MKKPPPTDKLPLSRRTFLSQGVALAGGLVTVQSSAHELGVPRREYGERASTEKAVRYFKPGPIPGTGASRTPLQHQLGIITPSALHFERHHSGVPQIDPARHTLMIHGLVERPLRLTLAQLKRFPSTSRIHFLECAGNTGMDHLGNPGQNAQISHGLVSCAEWTGVPLKLLLEEAGIKPGAGWVLAEGADASRMNRSIPLAKALDDVLVAYGQNGEALRPEQGYPEDSAPMTIPPTIAQATSTASQCQPKQPRSCSPIRPSRARRRGKRNRRSVRPH